MMTRTLRECKAAIRCLSAEDRAALIVWLSHGMPEERASPDDEAHQKSDCEKMRESRVQQQREMDAQMHRASLELRLAGFEKRQADLESLIEAHFGRGAKTPTDPCETTQQQEPNR
jgi:hypothetical protein